MCFACVADAVHGVEDVCAVFGDRTLIFGKFLFAILLVHHRCAVAFGINCSCSDDHIFICPLRGITADRKHGGNFVDHGDGDGLFGHIARFVGDPEGVSAVGGNGLFGSGDPGGTVVEDDGSVTDGCNKNHILIGPLGGVACDFEGGSRFVDFINDDRLGGNFSLVICCTEIDGCIFFNPGNRGIDPLDSVQAVFKLQSHAVSGSGGQSHGAVDPVLRIAVDDELKGLDDEVFALRRFGNVSGVVGRKDLPAPLCIVHLFEGDASICGDQCEAF